MTIRRPSLWLRSRTIHVWTVPIAPSEESELKALYASLSSDERARAERFASHCIRSSFIQCRGVLRILLGRYLGVRPKDVVFRYTPNGKPFLQLDTSVRFNVSHSNKLALFAFSSGQELGVDVEKVCRLPDMLSIADQFFCAEEAAELRGLPESLHEWAFYGCWTRKEAYVKAVGSGLSTGLDSFRVTVRPDEPARFVHINHDQTEAGMWNLRNIVLPQPYVAALAYRNPVSAIQVIRLPSLAHVHERWPSLQKFQ